MGAKKTGGGGKKGKSYNCPPAPLTREPADFRALDKEGKRLVAYPRAGCDIELIGRNKKDSK